MGDSLWEGQPSDATVSGRPRLDAWRRRTQDGVQIERTLQVAAYIQRRLEALRSSMWSTERPLQGMSGG